MQTNPFVISLPLAGFLLVLINRRMVFLPEFKKTAQCPDTIYLLFT